MARWKVMVAAVGLATALVAAVATAPVSSGAPVGAWSPSSWADGTGTVAFPGVVGLGPGSATTDATGTQVFGGSTLFMGDDTPFGGVFGSTQGESYAQIGLAPGSSPSTTTITFPSPSPSGFPAGWGFAVADIDADVLSITAAGPGGFLPISMLGFRGVFNLCGNVPKPSACGSPTPTDVPTWDPLTGTLTGSGSDTVGASAWFTPGAGVTSLTLRFSRQVGIPSYDLWFAVNTTSLSGGYPGDPLCSYVPGATAYLRLPDGSAVLDEAGAPVSVVVDEAGRYDFPSVVDAEYSVLVDEIACGLLPATTSTTAPSVGVAPAFTG